MEAVRLADLGIFIKKSALARHAITQADLLKVMDAEEPYDQNETLVSFGPHFGGEAAGEYIRRLEALGLEYGRDFFDFADTMPDWCQLYMGLTPAETAVNEF